MLNGLVRAVFIIPRVGDKWGQGISTLTLSIGILAVAWMTVRWIAPVSKNGALLVGLLWVGLTLAFEFFGGHLVLGAPWEQLLVDYHVKRRAWFLVLLTAGLAPVAVAAVRRLTK